MILHIDMDAFYASVECADNPNLRGKPLIIGGNSPRSVVSTASYEARKFGVHSAMPMYQAKKRCPQAVILPGRMKRYKEVSLNIMSILADFSPLIERVSIDEAYLDIAGCEKLFGDEKETALKIKKCIKQSVNITCSIGAAPNKFLAKIASDMRKPDGLTIIKPNKTESFINSLPINKVPGVGSAALKKLDDMGIKFLGQIKEYPESVLLKKLGKFGNRLKQLADCIDLSQVTPFSEPKSISSENTFSFDTADYEFLKNQLLKQSEIVGEQLRKKQLKAKTVTLKIKHADFKQITRSITFENPTCCCKTIYEAAVKLLYNYDLKFGARLIGVGASGLVSQNNYTQTDIFTQNKKNDYLWEKTDGIIDIIRQKFGNHIIQRASNISESVKKPLMDVVEPTVRHNQNSVSAAAFFHQKFNN